MDYYGGNTISGGRSALIAWLNPNSSSNLGTGAAQNFYGAATFIASANTSAGGSATSHNNLGGGHLYGINPTVSLSDGATFWQISGSAPASVGWNYGLSFGGKDGAYPFQPGSTLIYGGSPSQQPSGTPSAAWGIDMLVPTFSNGFMRSTGFQVDGAGNLTTQAASVGNFSIQSTVNGLTVTALAQKATVPGCTLVVSNAGATQFWGIGDKALTQYGGLYEVQSLITFGGVIAPGGAGSNGSPSTVVTLTLPGNYNGAVCSLASYLGTISASGTLSSVSPSAIGTCTIAPSGASNTTWPATSSDGSLTGVVLNVPLRVHNVVQPVADVTQTPPPNGTSVLGTQTDCYITSGTGTTGFFSACGAPLQLPLSFGPANDITLLSHVRRDSGVKSFLVLFYKKGLLAFPLPALPTARLVYARPKPT